MPLRIPHDELAPDTLDALLEEFVTRDGTNHAQACYSVRQVRHLLDTGQAFICFDEDTETCTIVPREHAPPPPPPEA